MKNVFFVYKDCCFYEIIIASYFLKFSEQDVTICSIDGQPVDCMEGYSINTINISDIDISLIQSFILTGGNINNLDTNVIYKLLNTLNSNGTLIAAICSGVDVLDNAGILANVKSTHSEDLDVCRDKNIITSRANGYVDFAIEIAKYLKLFIDDADLAETIDFWKLHKRAQ